MIGRMISVRILFAIIIAEAVMILWNLLLPSIIHTTPITYWQALGLLALARLLTGRGIGAGWGGRGGRWMGMSEEQRRAFRDEWKRRRG
jgi:hypothetical protein